MAFRVGDDYRENPMSLRFGGYTVIVEEASGRILEYDKIKYPWRYIAKLKKDDPTIKRAWWK